MVRGKLELTENQWNNDTEILENGTRVVKSDKKLNIYGSYIICGCGLYGEHCEEEDGKYWAHYTRGSSAD